MPAYKTCSTCGAPHQNDGRKCSAHERRATASPTTRKRGPEYFRIRGQLLKKLDKGEITHCYWGCGTRLTRENAQTDHKKAVSAGGGDTEGNLVLACGHCNSSRGGKDAHRRR